jgi:tRNA(Arg) A34 adenosine deaminase TadA
MNDADFMRLAIAEARAGIEAGQSPFGAVVIRDGKLVAAGHNEVWLRSDPTAHAEVVCLQRAGAALRAIDLSGAVMYTTCEPCPMCAAAIHWSRLDAVYYGATIADAERAGFNELRLSCRSLYEQGGSRVRVVDGVLRDECARLFDEFVGRQGRVY